MGNMESKEKPSLLGKRVILVSKEHEKLAILRETKDGTIFWTVKKVQEMAVVIQKSFQMVKLQDDIGYFWIDEKYLKLAD
jgi:hypothetical protein